MKTKKRILSAVLVLTSLFSSCLVASARETTTQTINQSGAIGYYTSAVQRNNDHMRQLESQLKSRGISMSDCSVVNSGMVNSLKDAASIKGTVSDYRIERSPKKKVVAEGYVGNQPKNGTKIARGGALFCQTSGGATVNVSVSFGMPFGTVAFSVPLGKKSSSGVAVNIPSTGYWKLYAKKTYEVQSYVIYHRTYVDDFTGYVWKRYGGGSTKSLESQIYDAKQVK